MLNDNNNTNNKKNNNNKKNRMHIRQSKVYLAAVGLNVPTTHWINSILGSLYDWWLIMLNNYFGG